MNITYGERDYLNGISRKISEFRNFLNGSHLPESIEPVGNWYRYLSQLKRILGNLDNDISFVACLMAKQYLMKTHSIRWIDVSSKPQSAPGPDIDVSTTEGQRVTAEVKTTIAYGESDLGAQQKKTFLENFRKLREAKAEHKYFFLTERKTFEIVKRKYYPDHLPNVTVVMLPEGLVDSDYVLPPRSPGSYEGRELGYVEHKGTRDWRGTICRVWQIPSENSFEINSSHRRDWQEKRSR